MKNLAKIPRSFNTMFCWNTESNDINAETIEKEDNLSQEEIDQSVTENKEAADDRKWRKKVNEMIEHMDTPTLKNKPKDFNKIPASKFLKLSAEKLRELFINKDGTVTFHDNYDAYMAIGLSDFFPKISKDQQFVVVEGVPYAYGARRTKDEKIGYGNPKYKAIKEGDEVDFFIAPPKEKHDFSSNDVSFAKDEHGNEVNHPQEFLYQTLLEDSANYVEEYGMENLSPQEEIKEKKEFRKKEEEIESSLNKYNPTAEKIPSSEREQFALNYFIKHGYTIEQSAGIIGNLKVESDNFSSDVISGKNRGDGGRAFGIAQWHPDRQALFCDKYNKPIYQSTFEEQLAFIIYELGTTEKSANNLLKKTTSAAAAAAVFDKRYERSSGEHRQRRINYAINIENKYKNLA